MLRTVLIGAMLGSFVACGPPDRQPEAKLAVVYDRTHDNRLSIVDWIDTVIADEKLPVFANPVDQAGADFVRLALSFGRLDPDYVDAYHGPKAWEKYREEPIGGTLDGALDGVLALRDIENQITGLTRQLNALNPINEQEELRVSQLKKFVRALDTRWHVFFQHPELTKAPKALENYLASDITQFRQVSFDIEVTDIYDEQIPVYNLSDYDAVLTDIDALLPGEGSTAERVDAFRNTLAIPQDKLKPVFDRAIAECRARTEKYFDLPEGEKFRMEFVNDKAWSGYNYYQGGFESLIQINTDFPIIIDRAVDLGCHEGYPGHHVWNLFIERELVGERGWIEYSVNPLFGPFGPIAEGSANYGIVLAFPGDEKITFEKEVLFPMAGLDPADAQKLDDLNALTGKLSHATNEVARRYLNGELTAEDAVPLIQKYYLASTEKSAQRLRFIDKYRGYVINYNIGRDRAKSWVEAAGSDQAARWSAFEDLLTRPMTPGDIIEALD